MNRLGVPDYDELVLVANSDKLDDQRDDLRLFISALSRGAREARRDPRAAAGALLDANKDLKARAHARERARHDSGLVPGESATGRSASWTQSSGATTAAGWSTTALLKELPDIDAAITNDLLPGEGL